MDGEVMLNDGTVVVCRQDSSTMWIIAVSQGPRRKSFVGTEKPTAEEKKRWSIAVTASHGAAFGYRDIYGVHEPRPPGTPHPEGWFTRDGAYRNEADEAAVIARWRERTGR